MWIIHGSARQIGDSGGTLITKIVMSLSKRGNRKALAGICEFDKIYFIRCNQELITRCEQFLCAPVTAFSLTSLFLERF